MPSTWHPPPSLMVPLIIASAGDEPSGCSPFPAANMTRRAGQRSFRSPSNRIQPSVSCQNVAPSVRSNPGGEMAFCRTPHGRNPPVNKKVRRDATNWVAATGFVQRPAIPPQRQPVALPGSLEIAAE